MKPLFETLQNYNLPTPQTSPPKKTGRRAWRKMLLDDLMKLTGWDDTKVEKKLWEYFSYPIYIPNEWIEDFKDAIIVHSGIPKKRTEKLFELLDKSRKRK